MSNRLSGLPDIQHVRQPDDSELCFAAIMSAVSGRTVEEAHAALVAAELSADDGSTPPMGETKLRIIESVVVIEPFQSPFQGADDPEGVLALMDEQFRDGKGVTLLHKKNDTPDDERHHWTLFTGRIHDGHSDAPYRTIDPLRPFAVDTYRGDVASMIRRSMDYAGVYGFAVSPEDAPA